MKVSNVDLFQSVFLAAYQVKQKYSEYLLFSPFIKNLVGSYLREPIHLNDNTLGFRLQPRAPHELTVRKESYRAERHRIRIDF